MWVESGTIIETLLTQESEQVWELRWTCTSGGVAEIVGLPMHGRLMRLVCVAIDGPTADWDVAVYDAAGADMLASSGVDAGPNTGERVTFFTGPDNVTSEPGVPLDGYYRVKISGGGSTKSGIVRFHLQAQRRFT